MFKLRRFLPCRIGVLFFAAMLAMTPASAAPAATPFLIGSWFGTGQPNDRSEMFIAHMMPNGDFAAQFRSCVKGKPHDMVQSGNWLLTGDLESITVITVDGQFYPRIDTYKILSHTGKKQVYRYERTGFVYTSERVDSKFQMPDCETIS